MAVSKRLRFEILRRDGHCCRYCGEHASPQVKLTVDHVLPVALGGTDDPSNLAAACQPCNAGKSATPPDAPLVEQVTAAAILWAEAVSVSHTAALVELSDKHEYIEFIGCHWHHSTEWEQYAPADWQDSIDHFRKRGLPIELLTEAADIALRNPRVSHHERWKYFMGVAWKMVTEMEGDAKRYFDYVTSKGGDA